MRCAGKAGVVTGASRGLGRETLLALCREGASIVALARDAEAGLRAAEEAAALGGGAVFVQGDGRREEDVVSAIDRCGADDPAAARAEMEAAYPGKRIAHPLEVATAVVFLVSDESVRQRHADPGGRRAHSEDLLSPHVRRRK